MASQKQSWPSFASILSVLSIVFYSAGFLRVELELNEQKKKIEALENIAAETKPSDVPNLDKFTRNAGGKYVPNLASQSMGNMKNRIYSFGQLVAFLLKRKSGSRKFNIDVFSLLVPVSETNKTKG